MHSLRVDVKAAPLEFQYPRSRRHDVAIAPQLDRAFRASAQSVECSQSLRRCTVAGFRLRAQIFRGRFVVGGGLFFVHGCSPSDRRAGPRPRFEPLLYFGNSPSHSPSADANRGREGAGFDCRVNGGAGELDEFFDLSPPCECLIGLSLSDRLRCHGCFLQRPGTPRTS